MIVELRVALSRFEKTNHHTHLALACADTGLTAFQAARTSWSVCKIFDQGLHLSLITEYEGGNNFGFFGTLSKTVKEAWGLDRATSTATVAMSNERVSEGPMGHLLTKCLIQRLELVVNSSALEDIGWVTSRLDPVEIVEMRRICMPAACRAGNSTIIKWFLVDQDCIPPSPSRLTRTLPVSPHFAGVDLEIS